MMMQEKIQSAKMLITSALTRSARPCVLWSGGKDSTVLLHLALVMTEGEVETVFWTLPWQRRKLAFAHRLQELWDLTVHDSPPVAAALCQGNGRIDVMEDYFLKGTDQKLTVARGTEPVQEGRPFVCGVDWLERPKARTDFPFDLALHGHKSCDIDPLSGPVPLAVDTMQCPGGTEAIFPLREWSDADIWTYTRKFEIPYDESRYAPDGQNLPDKGPNSDYYHACFRCCDARAGEFVSCPKRGGAMINSIAARVPWTAPRMPYCNMRTTEEAAGVS